MELSVSGRKQGWPVPEIGFTVTEQSVFVTNQCGFTKKQCGFVIQQCCFAIKFSLDSLFGNLFRKCPSPFGRGWREAPGEGWKSTLIRPFGPPSPRGRRTRASISANLDTSASAEEGNPIQSNPIKLLPDCEAPAPGCCS